ncbi:MAG: hypothetical protein CME71_01915 [Halobacteriovorax sp.]|nr:hypothetical protein [Halobacteriovorax sp.]
MKKLILCTILPFFSLCVQAQTPIISPVPVDKVFIPKGFDSNDMAEVVISGFLPNLCYKSPIVKSEVIGNDIIVSVYAINMEPENQLECTRMIVPFLIPINVGVLDRGQYSVKINQSEKGQMKITEALSPAVDEHVYAYVENVLIKPGSKSIILKGHNPSDCYVFDRVDYFHNDKDVYSVLPKMKQVSPDCPKKMVPFTIETEIPDDLEEQVVLLHVRTMNGKSVNAVFEK